MLQQPNIKSESQQRSQALIQQLLQEINSVGQKAIKAEEKIKDLKTRLEEREQLHEEFSTGSNYLLFLIFYAVALLSAYILDISLYGAVAEYFASHSFPSTVFLWTILKFLIPAAVIGIDVVISILICNSQEQALINRNFRHEKLQVYGWRIAGGIWAVGITIFAVITAEADQQGFSPSITWGIRIVLTLMALVLHCVIIFCGRPGFEAKKYILYSYQNRRDEREIRRLEKQSEDALQRITTSLELYYNRLTAYNSRYQPPLQVGLIRASVREFINKQYEYEVIGAPSEGNDRKLTSEEQPQQSDDNDGSPFTPTDSDWEPFDRRN